MPSIKSQIAELLNPVQVVELIMAGGFNEELGNPDRTTLLPLDAATLEVICRLNLPGVPLERLSVSESFLDEPLGFQQVVSFSCGDEIRPFHITITQCTSHVNAVKAMKRALCLLACSHPRLMFQPTASHKLGNYAVESEGRMINIWTRWTTVVQVHSSVLDDFELKPCVDIQALAAVLDNAMKAHKGTLDDLPEAGLDEDFTLPNFYDVPLHKTATIKVEFEEGIHSLREYKVIQDEKTCVVVDDIAGKSNGENSGGRFKSRLKVTFHNRRGSPKIAVFMAHGTSLWPVREELILGD